MILAYHIIEKVIPSVPSNICAITTIKDIKKKTYQNVITGPSNWFHIEMLISDSMKVNLCTGVTT